MTNKSRKFDPRHLDAYLGIGNVLIFCPLWRFYSWVIGRIMGWTLWALVPSRAVSFCDHDHSDYIAIMPALRAVLYHAPMFLGYVALTNCLVIWESIFTSSLAWAILRWRAQKFIGKLIIHDLPLAWLWVPDEPIAYAKVFLILPSKTVFLS